MGEALAAQGQDFGEVGVAYLRFALSRPAHLVVIFRPDLLDAEDRTLRDAQERAFNLLIVVHQQVAGCSPDDFTLASWSLVHESARSGGGAWAAPPNPTKRL